MQVPEMIRQIPMQAFHAWERVNNFGEITRNWIIEHWKSQRDSWNQGDFWQNYGKPFYDRNIRPLDKTDFLLITGSLIAAVAIMVVALKVFGIAAFPLAIGADALLVFGTWMFSRYRLRKHFDGVAWGHVDQIRRVANEITYKNQKFGELNQIRTLLQKPEFSHLEADIKQLDEEIRKFRSVVLAPYFEDKQQIVKAHIQYVKVLVQAHAQDKAIVEALEVEINKVGKKEQNLELLETQKQKLREIRTAAVRDHLNELNQQINDLVRTAQGPDFTDSKKAFMKHLEGLMRKLSNREIENLIPLGPLDIVAGDEVEVENDKKDDILDQPNPDDLPEVLIEEEK